MRQPAASITICSLLGPSAHHGLTVEKKSSKTKLSAQAGLLPAKNERTAAVNFELAFNIMTYNNSDYYIDIINVAKIYL